MCLKDIEDEKQITLILKTGVIYITITIFVNSSLFMNDQDLIDPSYSDKPSHERVISSISNQMEQVLLLIKLRMVTWTKWVLLK